MNKIGLLLAASFALAVGCGQSTEKPGTPFCEDGCELPQNDPSQSQNNESPNNQAPNNETPNNEAPNNNTAPPVVPTLKGVFISGHLGSYWNCPDEAYHPDADSDGICDEGEDCFTGCETAQVTLSLSNAGEVSAKNILVDRIELFGMDGISRAELPVSAVTTLGNATFDGHVAAGEGVVLRVEFQGPYNPWELLQPIDDSSGGQPAGGGIIETTFSSDTHPDLIVTSGEVYEVPTVDT